MNRQKIADRIEEWAYRIPKDNGNGFHSKLNTAIASGLHLLRHYVTKHEWMIRMQKSIFHFHVVQLWRYVKESAAKFWYGSRACDICKKYYSLNTMVRVKDPLYGERMCCDTCQYFIPTRE